MRGLLVNPSIEGRYATVTDNHPDFRTIHACFDGSLAPGPT